MIKRFFFMLISILALALELNADPKHVEEITLHRVLKGGNRSEVTFDPQVNYDGENNTVEVTIESEQMFEMRVIDIYGTVVYTCPVLMVDGTPTNYQLPELPVGIYTLKVESEEVSYEGTLVIE